MDSMSYRNNRPAQRPNEPEQPVATTHPPAPTAPVTIQGKRLAHTEDKSKKPLKIIVIIVALAIAAAAAWYFIGRNVITSSTIDAGKYQAIFLENGQTYFGKLSPMNDDYMRLTNIYYLQNKAQAEDDASPQSATKQNASDVELVKLGNEIHGPEDEMIVAKDQILFFENLKPAGTVSQTITNFQKK